MAYSFGSVQQLPTQQYRFGYQKSVREARRENSYTGFLRILIVVVELGLSLLPGVGTAAQIGIGLGAATANTALSAATGSLTGVGVGIDFGTALLPGLLAAKSASSIKKGINSINVINAEKNAIGSIINVGERTAFTELQKGLGAARKYSTAATNFERRAVEKAKAVAQRVATGKAKNSEKALVEISVLSQKAAGKARIFEQKTTEILNKYNVTMAEVEREATELQKIFDTVKNFKFSQRASKTDFIRNIEKLSGDDKGLKRLLNSVYVEPLKRSKGATRAAKDIVESVVMQNMIRNDLSDGGKVMFDLFINKLKYVRNIGKKELKETMDDMIKAMAAISDNDLNIFMKYINQDNFRKSFNIFMNSGAGESNRFRRYVKQVGSRRFNDKVVQLAQLVDPNDMGRYPVEKAYQLLKRRFDNYFQKRAFKKAYQGAIRGIKSSKYDLDKAFVRAGGVLVGKGNTTGVIGSRYILGIKKIGWSVGAGPVLVKFNKANTSSKTGKNIGGKKDIIVNMNAADFARLEIEGTKYWFAVGKKKGWFVSRGGKRATGNLGTIANEMSLFLGFVPIPALRNVLSIVSNWVENAADFARGDYLKDWIPKFERAFVRSAINRSGRLLTRVVVGGAYSAFKVKGAIKTTTKSLLANGGKVGSREFEASLRLAVTKTSRGAAWLGRELQRTSTTLLSTFEGTDKNGYFKFTNGSTRSRSTMQNLGHKIVTAAVPTSVRGALTRKGTRVGKTKGRQLVGIKRNFGQIARISSAVVPTGVPTIRQITRFK